MSTGLIDYFGATGGLKNLPDSMRAVNDVMLDRLGVQQKQAEVEQQALENDKVRRANGEADAYQSDLAWTLANDNTAHGFAGLMSKHPAMHASLKAAFDMKDKAAREGSLASLSSIYGPGINGRMDIAIRNAERLLQAETEAGTADDEDRAMVDMLKSEDPAVQKQALGLVLNHIGQLSGPEKMVDYWRGVAKDHREEELQPFKVAKATADADTAEAQADAAEGYYGGRARKAQADAGAAETRSAWTAAREQAGVSLKQAQVANLRSLIGARAKSAGVKPRAVTIAQVMAPIYQKVADGKPLTAGEQDAFSAYGRRGGGGRRGSAPANTMPAPSVAPPSATPAASPIIRDPRTGKRMTVQNGRWVEVR